jgi:hypothetical protein
MPEICADYLSIRTGIILLTDSTLDYILLY